MKYQEPIRQYLPKDDGPSPRRDDRNVGDVQSKRYTR